MIKKQYLIAFLLLIGLGIVSTMALTYDDTLTIDQEAYSISDSGATGSITRVKAIPLGSLDKVKLTFTLSGQSTAFDLYVTFEGADLDLTGATITGATGGTANHDLANNYIEFTNIATATSYTITIDASGITYPGTNSVWQDITGIFVTLGDYA